MRHAVLGVVLLLSGVHGGALAQFSAQGSAPMALPLKPAQADPGFMDVAGALVVVLLMGGLLVWLLKSRRSVGSGRAAGVWARLGTPFGSLDASRRLSVVEKLPIGPSTTLCVVRWDDAELLIWQSPHSAVLLDRKPIAATGVKSDGGRP